MKRFKKVFDENQESQIKSMQAKLDKIDDQTEALKDKIARLRDLRKTATVTDRIDDNIKAFKAQIEKLDKEHAHLRGVIKHMRNEEINEAVEVDDISVGKKKKKPAGVQVDEPLKGYAYNEDEQEEKYYVVRVQGKGAPGRDYMNVKTRAHSQKAALEKIRKQHPGNSYSIVKEDFETQLSLAIEEIELDEALSPKEKEKRLLMIKKAVEKLNRANIEKVKKQAMRDMKASGMFDDVIDENQYIGGYRDSSRDGLGPKAKANAPKLSRIDQLKKQLEQAYKQRDVHDEAYRKYMKTASEIRDRNPDDLGGIHGAERRADEQEEMAQRQTMKIQDLKDDIAAIKDQMK